MGNLVPKGWVETDLDTVIERMSNGSSLKQHEQFFEGALPISRIETIADETIDFNRVKYVEANENEIEKYELLDGDILFSHINSDKHLGKTAFFNNEETLLHGINLLLLRSSNVVNSEFIYLVLRDLRYSGKFIEVAQRSVNQSSINQKKLKAFRIPLPPRAEQDRIVAKVDALMAQHAAIQQAMKRIPQLLKDFRQQVLTQAVTGKLTEEWRVGKELEEFDLDSVIKERKLKQINFKIKKTSAELFNWFESPKGWKWSKMENVCLKITDGAHNTPKILDAGFPFLMAKDLSEGFLDFSQNKYISEKDHKELYNKCMPEIGDLLIVNIGAGSGNNVIIDKVFEFSFKNIAILKRSEPLESRFLKIYFDVRKDEIFRTKTRGGAQPFLSLTVLKDIDIVLPPLQEQQEIVRRVESLFEKAMAIEQRYEQLKTQIGTLPQSILHKAFKGELVAQLDSDGSAMELLEEIEGLKKEKKQKR
jgi:type I restriction enzyme S subunit